MALHLIIDGYNIIRQSPELLSKESQDLRWGREALLEKLAAYRRLKKHPITVVFDGWLKPGNIWVTGIVFKGCSLFILAGGKKQTT